MEVFGLVLFASIRYSPFAIRQKNKAGGTPADAIRNTSAPYGCGARPAGRAAPTGVPPRFSWQRTNAATQLQSALPGTQLRRPLLRLHLSQSSDPIAGRS